MKKNNLVCAAALALLGTVPLSAFACSSEPYIGEVCTVAFDWCPYGYLKADGSQLAINNYQALYSLLGTKFGGNGTTYFNLPDLRGRSPVGTGTADYGTTTVIGQKSGTPSVTLTANNLPQHIHPASATLQPNALSGQASLAVAGGTVSGQTITGDVTVNALNGANPPASGVNIPTASANTVGKAGTTTAFYPPSGTPIAVPSSHNLAVSGGTISGATAAGNVSLPATATTVPVTVGANSTPNLPVATVSPNLGMTFCIANLGVYPQRP